MIDRNMIPKNHTSLVTDFSLIFSSASPPMFFQYLSVFSRFTFRFILFLSVFYQKEINTPCFYNLWKNFLFLIRSYIIETFYIILYLSIQSGYYSFFSGGKFHFRLFSFHFYPPPFLHSAFAMSFSPFSLM